MVNQPTNPRAERFLETRDVQNLLNLSKPTLLSLVDSGRLPAVVLSARQNKRTLRFRPADVAAFVERNLTSHAA